MTGVKCGAVGSKLDEFTSPCTGMCAACSPRDGVTIPPMLVAAGVTQEELDAAADQGSVLPGVTKDALDAMVDQSAGLEAPPAHSWAIASFDNGVRFKHDPRPPEETGLWTWTCSACGFTGQTIGSVVPPANSPACVTRSARRGKISERFRSFLGGREVPAEKKWRFENLLCWMDRYQEEDFPIPPHWVSEALGIMAEANAK